jgi:hypothetical protein
MPLDLAADAWLRVGGQARANRRIVIVDRLEQAHVAGLHQVFRRLGAAPVLPDARPDQLLVPADHYLAGGRAQLAVTRLSADLGQQSAIIQLPQLRAYSGAKPPASGVLAATAARTWADFLRHDRLRRALEASDFHGLPAK